MPLLASLVAPVQPPQSQPVAHVLAVKPKEQHA